jgi:hypothetical protein
MSGGSNRQYLSGDGNSLTLRHSGHTIS